MRTASLLSVALLVLAVQGCSTCYTTSVVNVRPTGSTGEFELQDTQPYVTRLVIPDVLDVRLGLCTPVSEQYVCLHLRVVPGQTAELSEASFGLLRTGAPLQFVEFPPQQYQVICESKGKEPMRCPNPPEIGSEELAPKVLVHSGAYKDWRFEHWAHTVKAATTFRGVTGDPDPPAWKLFSKYSSWHEYRLQIAPATAFTEQETRLFLPSIIVSGKRYALPLLTIKVAPTKICPVLV